MKVNTNKLQDFIDFAPTLRNDDMSEVWLINDIWDYDLESFFFWKKTNNLFSPARFPYGFNRKKIDMKKLPLNICFFSPHAIVIFCLLMGQMGFSFCYFTTSNSLHVGLNNNDSIVVLASKDIGARRSE
jgi:hypothetical protein